MDGYEEYRKKMDELIELLLSLSTPEGKAKVDSYTKDQHLELLGKIRDTTKFILKQAEEVPDFDPSNTMKQRCAKILFVTYAKMKEIEAKK